MERRSQAVARPLEDAAVAPRSEVPAVYLDALVHLNVPMQRVRSLARITAWRAMIDLAAAAGSLAAVPLIYCWRPSLFTFIVAFLLSIRVFNSLAQLVHTSDHGGLFPSLSLNRIAGNLCAYCLGYTRTGHRLTHLDHHRYLNTAKDPDRIWGFPDQKSRDLVRMWGRDLLFLSAGERLLQYSESDARVRAGARQRASLGFLFHTARSMLPVIITQLIIAGWYAVTTGPLYYALLYVLPICTFYPAQIRLRAAVEHNLDAPDPGQRSSDVWISRTTIGNLLERLVFSPLGIHYHFEHHLFPAVPHYNLSKVHDLLVEHGFPIPTARGYLWFVLHKMRAERALRGGPVMGLRN